MAKKQQLKPKDSTSVSCTECDNATLMQWGDDPIIADCSAHHCREVASHKTLLSPIRAGKAFAETDKAPAEICRSAKQEE